MRDKSYAGGHAAINGKCSASHENFPAAIMQKMEGEMFPESALGEAGSRLKMERCL